MVKGIFGLVALMMPVAAFAQTTTYSYDALGRLATSTVATTGSSNIETSIEYDPAGNRKAYKVINAPDGVGDTGAGASAPSQRLFVVVPINGFTIIPIG